MGVKLYKKVTLNLSTFTQILKHMVAGCEGSEKTSRKCCFGIYEPLSENFCSTILKGLTTKPIPYCVQTAGQLAAAKNLSCISDKKILPKTRFFHCHFPTLNGALRKFPDKHPIWVNTSPVLFGSVRVCQSNSAVTYFLWLVTVSAIFLKIRGHMKMRGRYFSKLYR